jgi:hypothetical protein
MKLYPELAEEAFIQMGDFVGVTLKHCARRHLERAVIPDHEHLGSVGLVLARQVDAGAGRREESPSPRRQGDGWCTPGCRHGATPGCRSC